MENHQDPQEIEQPQVEESPKPKQWWQKYLQKSWAKWVVLAVGVLIVLVIALTLSKNSDETNQTNDPQPTTSDSPAVEAGKLLTNGQCEGQGVPYKLSVSPMKPEEFSIVVPYGLMIGGHVTPIDHQYFSPKDYQSEPDAYEVRAMADSIIVDITTRPRPFGQEYRMVFTVSCTFLYYYDLVTSLTPDIQQAYDQASSSREPLNIPIKAGQQIGRIGGQTLDFAVWDTTKPLDGFVVPEHYQAEPWKKYTADPLDYYTSELKQFILTRYARTVEPISGKIDHDIDGKLVGNWFLEGSNGYAGGDQTTRGDYWVGHLSFSPNHYVPDWFVISIGNYENQDGGFGSQFVSTDNSPDPKDVSTGTGLVKYQLASWSYYDQSSVWDQNLVPTSLSIKTNPAENIQACVLVQMTGTRKIKFQVFKDQNCANVDTFSDASTYTR